jgi:hypothetical protein
MLSVPIDLIGFFFLFARMVACAHGFADELP